MAFDRQHCHRGAHYLQIWPGRVSQRSPSERRVLLGRVLDTVDRVPNLPVLPPPQVPRQQAKDSIEELLGV